MILKRGDMFTESTADIILATSNGAIDRRGRLIMGAGAAKQLATLNPDLPAIFGSLIQNSNRSVKLADSLYYYGVLTHGRYGVFQTKIHWKNPSTPSVIERSARILAILGKQATYAVNFPGIGYGGLTKGEVLPILEKHWAHLDIEVWTP